MKNIGFTEAHEDTFGRFQKLQAAETARLGKRVYSWQLLEEMMDRFTNVTRSNIEAFALKLAAGIVETQINTAKKVKEGLVNPDHIDPEMMVDDWAMWIEQQFEEFNKPVSLRAYIADAEANKQVIIKQSDGALYLEKMLAHNHNAYLTPRKDEAMVFNSRDQAKAFLRKCGHEAGNWIIEPVNESK